MKDVEKMALALYWAEGTKTGRVVDFTNFDPAMLRLWIKYLRSRGDMDVSRLKAQLMMHSDMNESKLKQYWSKQIGIPGNQFTKIFVKKSRPVGTYRKKSKYGTLKVRYCSKEMLEDILHKINTFK